ncbi:hypothetical protein NC652_037872 [Populus alba x Populus x berolinensis]|nr:hypothetical protein NC652_037872 [Populus alba x Populus x berolinensis]
MSKLKFLPNTPPFHLSLLFFLTLFSVCNADSVLGLGSMKTSEVDATTVSRGCSNKIGECFEETEMESEISRRVLLMQKRYISYGTLKRDMVPCDKPGASYYDCNARQAHPYSRGCEIVRTQGMKSGVTLNQELFEVISFLQKRKVDHFWADKARVLNHMTLDISCSNHQFHGFRLSRVKSWYQDS